MVSLGQARVFPLTLPTYSQPTQAGWWCSDSLSQWHHWGWVKSWFTRIHSQKQASLWFPAKICWWTWVESHHPTETSSVSTSLPGLNPVCTPTSIKESVQVRAGQHSPASSTQVSSETSGEWNVQTHPESRSLTEARGSRAGGYSVSSHEPFTNIRRANGKLRLHPNLLTLCSCSSPPCKGQHSPGGWVSTPAQNEWDETSWSAKGPVGNFLPQLFSLMTAGSKGELLLPTSGNKAVVSPPLLAPGISTPSKELSLYFPSEATSWWELVSQLH